MTEPKDLVARARASLEGVTEGPWLVDARPRVLGIKEADGTQFGSVSRHRTPDARFIASARDLVPELCDALEQECLNSAEDRRMRLHWAERADRAEKELAEAREEIARLKAQSDSFFGRYMRANRIFGVEHDCDGESYQGWALQLRKELREALMPALERLDDVAEGRDYRGEPHCFEEEPTGE